MKLGKEVMIGGRGDGKHCQRYKGHLPVFGGSEPLPGWFRALQYRQIGDLTHLLKLVFIEGFCLFVISVHHFDHTFQGSQLSRPALCISKVKVF